LKGSGNGKVKVKVLLLGKDARQKDFLKALEVMGDSFVEN